MIDPGWMEPFLIEWIQQLLDSHCHWIGRHLIDRAGTATEQAQRLFHAPFVVVSHGMEQDPLLNYGNQAALDLWEMPWEQLVGTPSRRTAEPVNQDERDRLLRLVREQGYCDQYCGVRISAAGRRFLVEGALVWNVLDREGMHRGQAAMFSRWTRLSE